MSNHNPQLVKISNMGWYVETRTGLDGPFESQEEATSFMHLVNSSNAARMEFAGLQYTPLE
ncbi:MAG: hypothetical protein OEW97_06390 [Gammaproteobacteria bacterium]|nr:hypothetical protein [Gammaproteobacteria bacterium]